MTPYSCFPTTEPHGRPSENILQGAFSSHGAKVTRDLSPQSRSSATADALNLRGTPPH